MSRSQNSKKKFIYDMLHTYGFEADRWGHFVLKCENHNRLYRFKMQRSSVRVEYKTPTSKVWIKHHTTFYSKLDVVDYERTLKQCIQ